MPRIKEKTLTAELVKRGFESISVKREHPDGRVEVEANKLHPVPVEGGGDDLRARAGVFLGRARRGRAR